MVEQIYMLIMTHAKKTRMHSSMMRTARFSCCRGRGVGGLSAWGVYTPLWTESQTGVKTSPCPKLRLRAVKKIAFPFGGSWMVRRRCATRLCFTRRCHWRIQRHAPTPLSVQFFSCPCSLREIGQNNRLVPHTFWGCLSPHRLGNPGSATTYHDVFSQV